MNNCVLTIGKFEGIHLGHRVLINEVTNQAERLGIASAAMIFEPNPHIFLFDTGYKPLFTKEERSHILESTKLDHIFYCVFDKNFVAMSPKDFCKLLFEKYSAKLIIVGDDYRFGKDRAGDISLLQAQAAAYDAKVQVIPTCCGNGTDSQTIISTSGIRRYLTESNLPEANRQLGFPFFIIGIAAKGKQLGQNLGFPTLNIYPPSDKFLPPDGVYATQTTVNGTTFPGITNIGLCPTVSDNKIRSVETHLLDYTGPDLYGREIKVEFLEFKMKGR
ncbi:MAG: riboflavin biosynthesis protein RibF [Firmicutes bacterium]|nr:riboflavin biosynthesis protein RibF [Bacillota bacterium]